jgi:5-methylcytosine-specific restriction endonuclease McrA
MNKQFSNDDWDRLRGIAEELRRNDHGFWRDFKEKGIPALMGWLYYRGKCVYCGEELVRPGQLIGGATKTDHLLSISKSPNIGFSSHFNAVPACAGCNSIKAVWDRKRKPSDCPDGVLTQEIHDRLVAEARDVIKRERAEADAGFESERTNWMKALEQRDALENQPGVGTGA